MKMSALEGYGFSEQLIAALRAHWGATLLPVQERAIVEFGLLASSPGAPGRRRNLLVLAPSSAGKTLIGDLAAIDAARRRQRSFYLLPTRALAVEKFEKLSEALGPVGLRVVVTTRERREYDRLIRRGEFDICLGVAEKLQALSAQQPHLLANAELIVVDELHLVGDPERGPALEMLLAEVLSLPCGPRIIALSAATADGHEAAQWLDADVLEEEQRPVELRKGVVLRGEFHYLEHNSQTWGMEDLWGEEARDALAASGSPLDGLREDAVLRDMVLTARVLLARGESCLLFLPSKRMCFAAAAQLGQLAGLAPAASALRDLAQLEETTAKAHLERLLQSGVAVHHADLTREEREVVERHARLGEIRAVCATATLAMGMNLPFRNVLIDHRKWLTVARGEQWGAGEISRAEFENMAGRAGRLGGVEKMPFGRAMLFAENEFARDSLLAVYVESELPALHSALCDKSLADIAARYVAAHPGCGAEELAAVAEHTLARREGGLAGDDARAALAELEAEGLVLRNSGGLCPSPALALGAAHGLGAATCLELARWAEGLESESLCELEILVRAALCHDGRRVVVPLWRSEVEALVHERRLARLLAEQGCAADVAELVGYPPGSPPSARAAKAALAAWDWIGREPTRTVEQRHRMLAGALVELCADLAWIVAALRAFVDVHHPSWRGLSERMATLQACLAHSCPAQGLELARLGVAGLTRGYLLRLLEGGVNSAEDVLGASPELLRLMLPERLASALREAAGKRCAARGVPDVFSPAAPVPAEPAKPARQACLRIVRSRPLEVVVRGQVVKLTPKQFDLLAALADRPEECVSYDELYRKIWGEEEFVEPNQIRYHRFHLVERIGQVAGKKFARSLITTVHGRGLMLDLPREQVQVLP